MKQHNAGDRVEIFNGTDGQGNRISEGVATLETEIKQRYSDEFPAWMVLFDGDGEVPVARTIY